MKDGLNFIAIARSDATAREIENATSDVARVNADVRMKHNGTAIIDVLADSRPEILLLDLDLGEPSAFGELEQIMRSRGRDAVTLVTSTDSSLSQIRQLLRIGVDDFIPQPFSDQDVTSAIVEAVDRIAKHRRSGSVDGHVVTFMRSCGGAGATTLAVQSASDIMKATSHGADQCAVGLFDFDIQTGNLALSLDLAPSSTIVDVMEAGSRIDRSFLESTMTPHRSGMRVLASPETLVPLDALTASTAERIIQSAKSTFDYTIIDMPHAWTAWTGYVLGASSSAIAMCSASLSASTTLRLLMPPILSPESRGRSRRT